MGGGGAITESRVQQSRSEIEEHLRRGARIEIDRRVIELDSEERVRRIIEEHITETRRK